MNKVKDLELYLLFGSRGANQKGFITKFKQIPAQCNVLHTDLFCSSCTNYQQTPSVTQKVAENAQV